MDAFQCNDDLRKLVAENLASFDVRGSSDPDLRRAAVAVMVTDVGLGPDLPGLENFVEWSDEAALMLTRRSERLRNHPGQWAFPGGRMDPGESVGETALREMHEEVGIKLEPANVLGCLDDFVTRSGFAITPVVIWGGPDLAADPNPDEVASVHRIPLREFCRKDAPKLRKVKTSEHPILRMPVGKDHIAAPTAALIYQFREVCLSGKDTRVAHFEQPRFAWK